MGRCILAQNKCFDGLGVAPCGDLDQHSGVGRVFIRAEVRVKGVEVMVEMGSGCHAGPGCRQLWDCRHI